MGDKKEGDRELIKARRLGSWDAGRREKQKRRRGEGEKGRSNEELNPP